MCGGQRIFGIQFVVLIFVDTDGITPVLPPSEDELMQRAAPWGHLRVQRVATSRFMPVVFLLDDLLTAAELQELRMVVDQGSRAGLERQAPDNSHSYLDLEKVHSSAVADALNLRLATLVGVPEDYVEDGYIGFKNDTYKFGNLHVDNFHPHLSPPRVASFVIYLTDDFVGGETVLPFSNFVNDTDTSGSDPFTSADVNRWSMHLKKEPSPAGRTCAVQQRSAITFVDALCTRIFGELPCSRWLGYDWYCRPLLSSAEQACETGHSPAALRPRAGGAVLFYNLDEAGEVSAWAMHGSCGVTSGTKVVFAKFVRGLPRPWDTIKPRRSPMNFANIFIAIGTVFVVTRLFG